MQTRIRQRHPQLAPLAAYLVVADRLRLLPALAAVSSVLCPAPHSQRISEPTPFSVVAALPAHKRQDLQPLHPCLAAEQHPLPTQAGVRRREQAYSGKPSQLTTLLSHRLQAVCSVVLEQLPILPRAPAPLPRLVGCLVPSPLTTRPQQPVALRRQHRLLQRAGFLGRLPSQQTSRARLRQELRPLHLRLVASLALSLRRRRMRLQLDQLSTCLERSLKTRRMLPPLPHLRRPLLHSQLLMHLPRQMRYQSPCSRHLCCVGRPSRRL